MKLIIREKQSCIPIHKLKPGQFFRFTKNLARVYLLVDGKNIVNEGKYAAIVYVDADRFTAIEMPDPYSPSGEVALFDAQESVHLLEMVEPPAFRVV